MVSELQPKQLEAFLNEPQVDPHGQPIPGRDGQIPPRAAVPLGDVAPGRRVRIVEVPDGDPQWLRHLGDLGLFPGRVLCTGGWAGDLLSFDLDGEVRLLERSLAAHILVTALDEP